MTGLLEVDHMKNKYENMMKEMLSWIQLKTKELMSSLANTFEALQEEITGLKLFRNKDKPEKYDYLHKEYFLLLKINLQFIQISAFINNKVSYIDCVV